MREISIMSSTHPQPKSFIKRIYYKIKYILFAPKFSKKSLEPAYMFNKIQDIKEIENELDLLISEVEESGDKSRIANVMEKVELVIHTLEQERKEEIRKAIGEERERIMIKINELYESI